MKFFVENVLVIFPFNIIFPEQIQIMYILKKLFDNKSHGIMGIPPGIGFSIATICFFFSYNFSLPIKKNLIYCLRKEIDSISLVEQFRNYLNKANEKFFIKNFEFNPQITIPFGKKSLCIDERLKNSTKIDEIEDFCKSLLSFNIYDDGGKKKFFSKLNMSPDSYLNSQNQCFFFLNLLKKKKNLELKKIWTIKFLREFGIQKKICPYFFSKEILSKSDIVIGTIKKIFFSDFFFSKNQKRISLSYLIFEDIYDLESIQLIFSSININSLILKDSQRSILWLKKKFFLHKSKFLRKFCSEDFFFYNPKNQNGNLPKNSFDIFSPRDFNKKNTACPNFLTIIKKNQKSTTRIIHFFSLIQKINDFLLSKLNEKTSFKLNIKEFLQYLLKNICNLELTLNSIKFLNLFLNSFLTILGYFGYRKINGMIKLVEFFRIIGENAESFNENFKIFFSSSNTDFPFLNEPKINFGCLETSLLSKSLFENFNSVIFCFPIGLQLNFIFFILDCKPQIFGNLVYFLEKKNLKSFILNCEEKQNLNYEKTKKEQQKNLAKKSFYIMNKFIDENFERTVCLFPSYNFLHVFLEESKTEKYLRNFIGKGEIFLENNNLDDNYLLIENYKICCDLGLKTLLFGINGGITTKINLKSYYCRNLLIINPMHIEKDSIFQILLRNSKLFFKTQKYEDCKKFYILKNLGNILMDYFPSKKDFGILILINQEKIFLFENYWKDFWKTSLENESTEKIDKIAREIKKFFNKTWLNF